MSAKPQSVKTKQPTAKFLVPLDDLSEGTYFIEPTSGVTFSLWLKGDGQALADAVSDESFRVAIIGPKGKLFIDEGAARGISFPLDYLVLRTSK